MLRRVMLTIAGVLWLAPAALAQKPVTVWHVFNLETDIIYVGIKAFNESQNAYRIEPRLVPANQLSAELIKAIATGSVPDLVTMDNPNVASFAAQGSLTDLTDRVGKSSVVKPEMYIKGPWASGVWQGHIFAVPRDSNTLALCYNADMFRAKGLDPSKGPGTWSELVADATKLTDKSKGVFGFGFSATQTEEGVFQWLPFLYQAGGSIDHVDSPEAIASLQILVDFVKNGVASKDVINERQYEVTNTFMAGNAAIAMCGPWELPRLQKEAKFEWRHAVLPVKDGKDIHASSLGGYDWVVPQGAGNIDGAFKFIEFMSDPKILIGGWKNGRLAPRTDAAVTNPEWPQAYAVYREQLLSARARGPHPQWPELSRAMATAIQEAITGTKPTDQALKEAADKIKPILAKTPL